MLFQIMIKEATLNMFNRFIRHIKEGFIGVGRHAAMSVSSASAVTITLLLISIFVLLTTNLQNITQGVEGGVKIGVLIDYNHENQSDLDAIENKIENVSGVKSIEFFSKEDELKYFLEQYDEDEWELFMPSGSENPMKNAFYVEVLSGDMIQEVAHTIKEIDGVSEVEYGGDGALSMVDTLESIRAGGFILVLALSFLAIYLVQNTIKLTIMARSNEIWIMRNVGAKNGFIRAPFVIEGIIIGVLGSIIPIIVSIFAYIYFYNLTGGILFSNVFKLIPPHPYVLYVSLVLLAIGVVVGLIGSFLSVSKYLRWKR